MVPWLVFIFRTLVPVVGVDFGFGGVPTSLRLLLPEVSFEYTQETVPSGLVDFAAALVGVALGSADVEVLSWTSTPEMSSPAPATTSTAMAVATMARLRRRLRTSSAR